jgi:hypothetical protein
MKNLEYWKQSLENVLQDEIITDDLVEKIISISEMEYEYTEFESNKSNESEFNPLENKIKELENKVRIYEIALCDINKADYVHIIGERVEWVRLHR